MKAIQVKTTSLFTVIVPNLLYTRICLSIAMESIASKNRKKVVTKELKVIISIAFIFKQHYLLLSV